MSSAIYQEIYLKIDLKNCLKLVKQLLWEDSDFGFVCLKPGGAHNWCTPKTV